MLILHSWDIPPERRAEFEEEWESVFIAARQQGALSAILRKHSSVYFSSSEWLQREAWICWKRRGGFEVFAERWEQYEELNVEGFALVKRLEPNEISVRRIQRVVAEFYKITRDEILAFRRSPLPTKARLVGMYLCTKLTTHSLPHIARRFRRDDHTTVINARDRVELLMASDEKLRSDVDELLTILG